MERGDIYLISLGPTAEREQQGTWPVLVVSPMAFNCFTNTPVVLPITNSGNHARTSGFSVPLIGTGTSTTGVIRCDQPRTIDLTVGHAKKLESVSESIMDEVLARLAAIFE
jgi:Growth inhibitor